MDLESKRTVGKHSFQYSSPEARHKKQITKMKNTYVFWSVLKKFYKNNKHEGTSEKGRSVTFEYNGRSGTTIYHDGVKTTRFYTEAGGGDCLFYLVIPPQDKWEQDTGYPLADREAILSFIGEESIKKQALIKGLYYKVTDRYIIVYQK